MIKILTAVNILYYIFVRIKSQLSEKTCTEPMVLSKL